MPNGKRLWRTAAGDLVEDGHPDAVALAYGVGDDLKPEDADKVRTEPEPDPEPEPEPEPEVKAEVKAEVKTKPTTRRGK